MPLFFLISGFFFESSLKMKFQDFIFKKGTQLLLPCFIWGIIFSFYNANHEFEHRGLSLNWHQLLKSIVSPFSWPFWFLRELFISFCILYLFIKVFKQNNVALSLSLCFVLVAPYCSYQRFLFPMFLTGHLLKYMYQIFCTYRSWIFIVSSVIFCICLWFWDGNYTIYVTPSSALFKFSSMSFDFSHILIDLIRWVAGLSGSIFFLALFQRFYPHIRKITYLQYIGRHTMPIYIIQTVILEIIINNLIDFSNNNLWLYNIVITPIISLAVIIICTNISFLIHKFRYTDLLLFGNNRR